MYTHKIEVLRAELDMLQPKYDALKDSQRAEREQAQKDVLVQHDSGVFVTAEQHAKIKSGEMEIVVRGKKKDKPKEETNAEAEQNDTTTVDANGTGDTDATGDVGQSDGADGTAQVSKARKSRAKLSR